MAKDKIYAQLNTIFNDIFLRDDIVLKPETTADDIEGWDSFRQIEIILAVEEHFGIKLSTREIDSLRCVGDLANVIGAKQAR